MSHTTPIFRPLLLILDSWHLADILTNSFQLNLMLGSLAANQRAAGVVVTNAGEVSAPFVTSRRADIQHCVFRHVLFEE